MSDLAQSSEPIFLALARFVSNGILTGAYPAGTQVPSTTELAAFFKVNPITAGRALTELTDKGVLEKRRGIGTFVTKDAVDLLRREHITNLARSYIDPLVEETHMLSIPVDDLIMTIRERYAAFQTENQTINYHDPGERASS